MSGDELRQPWWGGDATQWASGETKRYRVAAAVRFGTKKLAPGAAFSCNGPAGPQAFVSIVMLMKEVMGRGCSGSVPGREVVTSTRLRQRWVALRQEPFAGKRSLATRALVNVDAQEMLHPFGGGVRQVVARRFGG